MKMNDIVNESAELTPQQKKLAHYGRILMNQASTTKNIELANVMSRVGNELSGFGELFAARTMAELVQKSGTPENIIKKLIAHASKIDKHKVAIAKDHDDGGLDDTDDEDEFDSPSDADTARDADRFAKGE